ncbi:MAG: hypothetical protein DBP02_19805 [gamma proteobacterium symbiont of Ctena orbiculata]|nr:MAG: hypothetical protein DBP02_19805 [gamma proteobacterium symbiont of Ctena orbiculata]
MPVVDQPQEIYHAVKYILAILEDIELSARSLDFGDEWDGAAASMNELREVAYLEWEASQEGHGQAPSS